MNKNKSIIINTKDDKLLSSGIKLAKLVIKILDDKSHRGCDNKSWFGFQNGNGEEVGKDIERLIIKAKKIISINK